MKLKQVKHSIETTYPDQDRYAKQQKLKRAIAIAIGVVALAGADDRLLAGEEAVGVVIKKPVCRVAAPAKPVKLTEEQLKAQKERWTALVTQLSAEEGKERKLARQSLAKEMPAVKDFLTTALKETDDPEVKISLQTVLKDYEKEQAKKKLITDRPIPQIAGGMRAPIRHGGKMRAPVREVEKPKDPGKKISDLDEELIVRLESLVEQLGAEGFKTRKAAREALTKEMPAVRQYLQACLDKSEDPEVKDSLKKILDA